MGCCVWTTCNARVLLDSNHTEAAMSYFFMVCGHKLYRKQTTCTPDYLYKSGKLRLTLCLVLPLTCVCKLHFNSLKHLLSCFDYKQFVHYIISILTIEKLRTASNIAKVLNP